jgi:hypothetical protein
MSSESTAWPGPREALADADIITRARFFGIRHPLAVSLAIALIVGIGGVALFGYLNGIAMEGRAGLMLAYTAACLVQAVLGIVWLVVERRRVATPAHFAGAFAAAISDERPHLAARLKARAASRITDEPVTTNELVATFNSVRAEHGKRAQRRRKARATAIAAQQEFLSQDATPA